MNVHKPSTMSTDRPMHRTQVSGISGFLRRTFSLILRAASSWVDHRASTMGASIAFYTLFSMGPVLLIAITLVGAFYGHDAARHDLLAQIRSVLGPNAATQVAGVIDSIGAGQQTGWQTAVGIIASLFTATTVFAELKDSLDVIWETPKRKDKTIWLAIRRRLLSFGVVISLGFVLLASMLLSAIVAALTTHLGVIFGESVIAAVILGNVITTLVVTLLFSAIFKLLPDRDIPMHVVWQSAFLTALLYMAGKSLIALYLGSNALASSYGAAGAVVLILVWMYYSAQVFLFGAELSRQMVLAHEAKTPERKGAVLTHG